MFAWADRFSITFAKFTVGDRNRRSRDQWHRIGLVWDGSYRCLYVDGVEVVSDNTLLTSLKGSDGGLYLGAGSSLAPGTFFSGLIDDVRIYNPTVRP
ncbi:MAG: LamG-like jellyroll fold domain-containing protein [Planctomycetota bacterium]